MRLRSIIAPLLVAALVIALIAGVFLVTRPARPVRRLSRLAPTATPSQVGSFAPADTSPSPQLSLPPEAWVSWAYLGAGGTVTTGGDPGRSSAESMIKVGIAADYLHGLEAAGRDPDGHETDLLTRMIRDSDDQAAEALYQDAGRDAVVRQLIDGCGLADTTITSQWWSKTELDAADAAKLGACVRDARIASPRWSAWILDQMRQVEGEGRFGVIDAQPTDQGVPVAIKNGWTVREDSHWHVNCLAVTDRWVLAVLARYPAELGLGYGADICRQVAVSVLPPAPRGRPRSQ